MSKSILHDVRGQNFHGPYSLRLRGPAEGFVLSASQARRYERELCSNKDCQCGGGYGAGLDPGTARVYFATADDLPRDLSKAGHADYQAGGAGLVLLPTRPAPYSHSEALLNEARGR